MNGGVPAKLSNAIIIELRKRGSDTGNLKLDKLVIDLGLVKNSKLKKR